MMSDLKTILKQLPNNMSHDAEGFINKIFKGDAAGSDLLMVTLKLMNLIKNKHKFSKIVHKCNITPIHKKNTDKSFQNYRGVFGTNILRCILDRLIYNDSYEK